MVGHNVSMLMPAPYKQQHNGYLARYKQTHKAAVIGQGMKYLQLTFFAHNVFYFLYNHYQSPQIRRRA